MNLTQILVLVGVMAIAVVVALIVINHLYEKDKKDEKLSKYVLLFDRKTKKFSEQRSHEFEEEEDVAIIAINDSSEIHGWLRFIYTEKYHISTVPQAHKAFREYLDSRKTKFDSISL